MLTDKEDIKEVTSQLSELLEILSIIEQANEKHLSVTVDNKSFDVMDSVLIANIKTYVSNKAKQHLDVLKLSTLS